MKMDKDFKKSFVKKNQKSKQNFNFEKLCSGLVYSPKRIRLRQTSFKATNL